MNPELAVGAVAVVDGQLLLIRRGHAPAAGTWSVPGGHVNPGETLHEAVVRETAEETGLEVVVERFLGWNEHIETAEPSSHLVILDFLVDLFDPDAVPVAGDDAHEARWVPLEDVGELRLAPGLYEFLTDHGVLSA